MDVTEILKALGGGFPAVVILGLAWAYREERKRSNDQSDKQTEMFLNLSRETTAAINALTDAIRSARSGQ